MPIGRDMLDAHHICDQIVGPVNSPFAQRLKFGWVIIGDVSIGNRHVADSVNSFKTYVHGDGRPSIMKPCTSAINIRELLAAQNTIDDYNQLAPIAS